MAQTRPTDFSGTWFVANNEGYALNNVDNYYLVPARDPKQEHFADAYFHNQYSNTSGSGDYTGSNYGDPEKPFITTHKNNASAEPENLIWRFEATGDGYYYIIHALTGKYLVYEYPYYEANNRKSVHLQTLSTPGANAKFAITGSASGISIRPISLTSGNRFLNPATRNTDTYYGTDTYFHIGMIGVWSGDTGNSIWHYEEGGLVKPVIVPNAANKEVNIKVLQTGVTVYYTLDGSTPDNTSSSLVFPGGMVNIGNYRKTVKAVAYKNGTYSSVVTLNVDFRDVIQISALSGITDPDGKYILTADIDDASGHTTIANFTGEFNGDFHVISGLTQPLFGTIGNGIVRNVVLDEVNIVSHTGNTGAIACEINEGTCIYNCGILSGSVGGTGDTGGIVGLLTTTSANTIPEGFKPTRVINCYSFANITAAGTYAAGIVGNNTRGSNSQYSGGRYNNLRTAVVNCMFYGDVLAGTNKYPVYGNKRLDNDTNGINNYNYFLDTSSLDNDFTQLSRYNCSWPVEERYLTRFEYFRSILNSNRRLCTWWVTLKQYDDQTDDDLDQVAKWVLDPSIAPYPILKPWGKYPSIINPDPTQVWDEASQTWKSRDVALPSQGKKLSTLTVTVNGGSNNSGATTTLTLPVLDMDTLHYDYGYAKVQLPYYNEQFGNPNAISHEDRYGHNYTDKVVTGWMITSVTGGTPGTFIPNWENGYNFADRHCTDKDLYSVSGRVFAQGGYYYVPEGVTAITIEAYWGKAVYVRNTDHYIDRVNLGGSAFTPAGTYPSAFHGNLVYKNIKTAINAGLNLEGSGQNAKTVYDQAIVLVGNLQLKTSSDMTILGWSSGNGNEDWATHNRPFTITTVDLDFDNEPDYCFEWQFSRGTTRLNLHPIRFDFLPVPTLGMAIRGDNNNDKMAIGVFAPRGHFEITETSFLHTGQFEYDSRDDYRKEESPLILNGGQFEQFVSTNSWNNTLGVLNRTKYIILGGHVWMKEFTPGKHGDMSVATRHCAVSVMGGDFERFCLSGVFISNNQMGNYPDNPHCYTNGGNFGTMSGAGMEDIDGDVIFKIDHSVIGEFYGGGLNAARPVSGSIHVTINNSVVGKYCGGPKTGDMEPGTTVTTIANNTVFGQFYGGGDGGTNFNRNRLFNLSYASPDSICEAVWRRRGANGGQFDGFTPLQYVSPAAGYEAQFEFELIDISSGYASSTYPNNCSVMRTYRHEAQFTATMVQTVTSTLTNCTVLQDFYGGGNLGEVIGDVTSTLNNTIVYGSAYGGGYSAAVPSFCIHDKSSVVFPTRDMAGVNHPGSLDFVRDNGEIRYYKWIHDLPAGVQASTSHPDFQYQGEWYCYTEKDMTDLGSVGGNTILNITGATKIYGSREVLSGGNSQIFYDGAAFGGGNESPVFGNSTVTVNGTEGLLVSNVYGGGNIATTGRPATGGNSRVEIHNGTIGVVNPQTGLHYENSGSVYGGGKGTLEDNDQGRVYGNAVVLIQGGRVLNNVYGGGQLASVGYVDNLGEMVNGYAAVTISGGEVGPLDMTGLNAYVYGGGQGVEIDPNNDYRDFANVNHTLVTVSGGTVWGSIFGGGADGHVWSDTEIRFTGGTIGTNGVTSWDGNIFGGGRNFKHTNRTAGRVGGNISITMTGGVMKGNIYGGGRLGNTGVDILGVMQEDANDMTFGHITVDVSGGTIGYDYENGSFDPVHYIDTIGCVYGGGKGITFEPRKVNGVVVDTTYITNWHDFAVVKTTDVRIGGNAYLWGNVYGGSEQSVVRDSTNVTIQDNAVVRLRAFAGGRGFMVSDDSRFKNAGDVGEIGPGNSGNHGLARITLKDNAHVQVCLYGGAKIANIQGNAHVTLDGGSVGRRRTLEEIHAHPTHCYVFGSGQGNPMNGEFNEWTNVDTAFVTIRPGSRVFGSVFGGGEDGHVLEDIFLDIELGQNDSIGTHGYSGVDGNIFSGGRGFHPQALTAGGTRGNIHTHIHGAGHILGSVFGGGRIASAGINLVAGVGAGDTIQDTPNRKYGYTYITIEDDVIIGHDHVDGYKIGDVGGNVYGGAKGADVAPNTVAGRMSHVKQTEVIIRGNVWVKGTVNGGGESGHVWRNTKVVIDGNCTIGVDRVGEGHLPLDSLIYSGNVFGGSWGSDALLYPNQGRVYGNDTVLILGGHIRNNIYGGGEYASIGTIDTVLVDGNKVAVPRPGTGHTTVIMHGGELGPLDMSGVNAYVFGGGKGVGDDPDNIYKYFGNVFSTYVRIEEGSRVWGSVFGGGEDGHVLDTTHVDMLGGTLGTTGVTTWDGNIFGGGRNFLHTNLSAGRVGGNITVNVEGGNLLGSIYGGGRLASVGIDENGERLSGNQHGVTRVFIRGGVIGNDKDGFVGGNVYGGCKGYVALDPAVDPLADTLSFVRETHVTVMGDAIIKGSVYGGGEDGRVGEHTNVSISGNVIIGLKQDPLKGNVYGGGRGMSVDQNGQFSVRAGLVYGHTRVFINGGTIRNSVYGGGNKGFVSLERVVDMNGGLVMGDVFGGNNTSASNDPIPGLKTVNIRGGRIIGHVYGSSNNAVEGNTLDTPTSYVNITGGTIDQDVYGAGHMGTVNGTVMVNIGTNAIFTVSGGLATPHSPENVFFNVSGVPTAAPIVIGGSVYCGSDHYGSDPQHDRWNNFDITGYAVTFIDGTGYDTEHDQANATLLPYMNIAGGLYGSGTHCESGALGREVMVRNYGIRNTQANGELVSATRTFTTIQRCGLVALDNANINLAGSADITGMANGNYAVLKVDETMYVSNASSIVLGGTDAPAHMDSIHAIHSCYLTSGSIYDQGVLYMLPWDWIALKGNTPETAQLYRHNDLVANPGSAVALTRAQENVILFNADSRLWVRSHNGSNLEYGELQGFFRMRADFFEPYGVESFAYARPKLTAKNVHGLLAGDELNKDDGGFLSYVPTNNFHTQVSDGYQYEGDDGGNPFTQTKQYPYTNVIEASRTVNCEYRLWVIPKMKGGRWYVDGRETGGLGVDNMDNGRGRYPNMPKMTITATNGIYDGAHELDGTLVSFNQAEDIVYVVGHVNSKLETGFTAAHNLNYDDNTPLRLFRYPGGHQLSSNTATDPGPNYADMLLAEANYPLTMNNVLVDGLYGHSGFDNEYYTIPTTFNASSVTEPLVVTKSSANLTLNGGTRLMRGYNNTDGQVWFTNPDYVPVANVHHGGALFVDAGATVNVAGLVTIIDNLQNNDGTPIESNVYLPSFTKYLNITGPLASGTEIGVTNPIRNTAARYTFNTFSPVAVASNATDAQNAWSHNTFYDDLDWFFYREGADHGQRTSYYSSTIPDYVSANTPALTPANTVFFGWTWANVVRTAPSGFAYNNINSAEDLAWLASLVNGLNGQTATSLSSVGTITQTADINLQQYVWVPIGADKTTTGAFSGTYDGQGHLITDLDIDYIGTGDLRYQYTDYGLFGMGVNGTVNRTFVVSGLIRPLGTANIGGLMGKMQGQNAVISNSEAALQIVCPMISSEVATGGLVGKMKGGDIYSSMAMPDITFDQYYVVGGLVGITESYSYTSVGTSAVKAPTIRNSFVNAKFTMLNNGANTTHGAGGLVGMSTNLVAANCYVNLYDNVTLPKFSLFVAHREEATSIRYSYAFNGGSYSYCNPEMTLADCARFTPTMDADNLGYMYYDNTVTMGSQKVALFKKLNEWVRNNNSGNIYSYWSRPGLDEINGDLPVLQLCNGATGLEGNGDFRSLATYNNGHALQYGGEVRDGAGHQFGSMLARAENIFVYGDVDEDLSTATVNANKVSIYEHAAIMHPGSLGSFNNTYVGISFDNSHVNGVGSSSIGVNFGLGEIGMGPYPLPRDWHMFSSPLSNAPLGFDYGTHNEAGLYNGGDYDNGRYYNNPWVDLETEFSWLNNNASGNNRYWMKTFAANNQATDCYFPTQVNTDVITRNDNLFIVGSDECPTSGVYRYPYGMDLYTWNEPQYHWINFKRNGPNHWHSDPNSNTGLHDHLDYVPVANATPNVNESSLIVGRGYMAAICDTTFMQSHGRLNAGNNISIALTKQGQNLAGWNLIGNPYHAYLDFEEFVKDNGAALGQYNSNYFYVVYDADGYSGFPESSFLYYPSQGSSGGAYAGRYLHPHQGFYVLASENNHSVTFTEDMTVTRTVLGTDAENNGHFRGGDDDRPNYPLVNLFLSSENGCHDITVIEFERPEWGGARKMKELRMGNGVFYAQHDDTHYAALFAKAGIERVPLWFEAKEDDVFTIKWNTANGDFHSLFLVDNLTGVRYDMIENESYTFQGHVGDYPSRFYITFSVTDVEEHEDDDDNFVFFDGSEWVVTGDGMLDFIDMHGRVLWSNRLSGGQNRVGLPQVACGVYLLRLTNVEGTKVQKIIVTR